MDNLIDKKSPIKVKNTDHKFQEPKVTLSNDFFCPTHGPKPKDIYLIIFNIYFQRYKTEKSSRSSHLRRWKQRMLSVFCLINDLNDKLILKVIVKFLSYEAFEHKNNVFVLFSDFHVSNQ